MKLAKGEKRPTEPMGKLEIELESKLIDQLQVMEKFTKISRSELLSTALRRFISAHKDYFPDDYK